MKSFLLWIDDRTGFRAILRGILFENIPGGARWRYVWGSTLAFAELGFVPADTPVSIDVTQVGSTFPGENLVTSVRF